jgi:hypothetical protein
LALGIGDIDRPDAAWKMRSQRRLARIEVVADDRPAAEAEIFN